MTQRRTFIKSLAAGGAGLAGLACGGSLTKPNAPGSGGENAAANGRILVVVQLAGGNDLLDTMTPLSGANYDVYRTKRPTLKLDPSTDLLDIGNGLGLNKSFGPLLALHQQGKIAWMPGIGMPNPSLSHFQAEDLWNFGKVIPNDTGWLGRIADQMFDPSGDVLRGIAVNNLTGAMVGQTRSFVNLPRSSTFRYPTSFNGNNNPPDAALLRAGFNDVLNLTGTPSASGLGGAKSAGKNFYNAQEAFTSLFGTVRRNSSVPYPGDSTYPDTTLRGYSHLASQLKYVAELLAKGFPTQIFHTETYGYDTHSNHPRDHTFLLKDLGATLAAFYQDLASISGMQDRVMVMVWSEFGRRVPENNGGLDHGTAGLSFCLGKGVTGGVYSSYPDLTNLVNYDNMTATLDFRQMYATVIDKWLGGNSQAIIGGTYANLTFI